MINSIADMKFWFWMMRWGFQKHITKQLNLKISFSVILWYDNLYCPILSRSEPASGRLGPAICRPVTNCRPEPQSAVANIPKRDCFDKNGSGASRFFSASVPCTKQKRGYHQRNGLGDAGVELRNYVVKFLFLGNFWTILNLWIHVCGI